MLEIIIMEIQIKIHRELIEKETDRQIEAESETKKEQIDRDRVRVLDNS